MRHATLALMLAACIDTRRPPTEGERGELSFIDLTTHADDSLGAAGFAWPVAVGAEVELGVQGYHEEDGDLAGAILDGTAFTWVRDVGRTLRLAAVEEGSATVLVNAPDGAEDELVLDAAPIANVDLIVHGDRTIGSVDPTEVLGVGLSALPDARLGVAGFLFDADGGRLTGQAALAWTSTGTETFATFDQVANGAWVTFGDSLGVVHLTAGPGAGLDVTVVSPEAPSHMRLYTPDYEDAVSLSSIETTAGSQLFGLVPFDDAGNYLSVPDELELEVEILEGPDDLLTGMSWEPSMLGFIATFCPGTGTVRFTLGTATLDVPVTVGTATGLCGD